jgi:20S proteasome subunit alpha 7
MSGAGTGYDLSPTTYNPEGRVFQVDYAIKATENGGTILGLRCRDGILLAGEKNVISRMIVEGSNKYIQGITKEIGAVMTGVLPDGRSVITRARQEAAQYEEFYGHPIKTHVLADRIAQYMYMFTLYGGLRPFGASIILAGKHAGLYRLFMIDPSGSMFEYYSCTAGKGSQVCRTEIDKLKLEDLSVRDAVYQASRMLIKSREETRDKRYEIDFAWVCDESHGLFTPVPIELRKEMEARAKDDLEREERGE